MVEEKASGARVRMVEVRCGQQGQRLDNFLAGVLGEVPKGLIYKIIRTGQVRINGGRAKPSSRLETGDTVRVPPVQLRPKDPKRVPRHALDSVAAAILEEQDDLIVLNKPAGMAVHGGSGVDWGVIDAIRQLRDDPGIELVHRLDRETSGLLLLARGKGAMRALQRQFREGVAEKRYFCLLDGRLPDARTRVEQPLRKAERGGQRIVQVDPEGKPALTEFQRLESLGDADLCEANLLTGRTHQIRVHAAWLGCALAGDPLYSGADRLAYWRLQGLKRLFLHAHSLVIEGDGGVERRFSCPLPKELAALVDRLQA